MTRLTLAALLLLPLPLFAQTGDHAGHDMSGMPMGDMSPPSVAFAEANATMHEAMNITFTGNADVDFIAGMIAHHEGAVAMAQIVLEYGTDPEVRALAENIITAQEAEIAWMQDWLAAHSE
jgi:uncharacterized protein (DUF305 family)